MYREPGYDFLSGKILTIFDVIFYYAVFPNRSFFQTKKTAGWLCEEMTKEGHGVALLTGDLTVEQRISILDRFRDGKHKVLITTNVLARGK